MDIQQEWQKMNAEFDKNISNSSIANFKLDKQSHSFIDDLQTKLKWKLNWLRVISLPLLVGAIFIKTDLQYLLLAVFISYELFRALGMAELKKIKIAIYIDRNTKQVLEDNLSVVKRILRMENIFGYVLLPISAPIGLLGYRLFVHHDFSTVLNLPNLPVQMVLFILIGIPLIWLTKKMNNRIFKAPIENLTEKINQLSEEK